MKEIKWRDAKQCLGVAEKENARIARAYQCYTTRLKNPIAAEMREANEELEEAEKTIIRLVRKACLEGHGKRYINNRLPDGWEFCPTFPGNRFWEEEFGRVYISRHHYYDV